MKKMTKFGTSRSREGEDKLSKLFKSVEKSTLPPSFILQSKDYGGVAGLRDTPAPKSRINRRATALRRQSNVFECLQGYLVETARTKPRG